VKAFHVLPTPALQPFVDRIWGWESTDGKPVPLPTLLPGTGAELYLHHKTPFRYLSPEGQPMDCPRGHLFFLRNHAMRLLPSPDIGFIAVRFKCGMVHRFTRIPGRELSDRTLPVEEIFDPSGSDLLRHFAHAAAPHERLPRLQSFLLDHLKSEAPDPLVESAVPQIYRHFSSVSIDALARTMPLGSRQFERRFLSLTGSTPMGFKCLSRFQHTVRALMLEGSTHPRDAALSHGYYDQAHFIHDFRKRPYRHCTYQANQTLPMPYTR